MCEVDTNNEAPQQQQPEAQGANSVADVIGASGLKSATENNTYTDNSSKTKENKDNWSQKYGLLVSFFFAVFACSILYFWAVNKKLNGLNESQKKIVEISERHNIKTDNKGKQPLIVFQQPQENQERFYEEIKSLLDLQQSYIQDNFESFEIWAGILTIIFLVFSFFSLQKSEQMEQQSREALKKIKKNMEASDTKLSDFDNAKTRLINSFESLKEQKIGDFDNKSDQSIKTFNKDSAKALDDFEKDSTKLKSDFENDSSTKLKSFEETMSTAKAEVITQGKSMISSERDKVGADFQERANNLWKFITENEYKNILASYQETLKSDYEKYRMQLQNLIDNPVDHDIAQGKQPLTEVETDTEEASLSDEEE